jgi:hypothetical protein
MTILRMEGLGELKKINDLIGTRKRDLPDGSTACQQSTCIGVSFE